MPQLEVLPKSKRSLSSYTTLRNQVREALRLGRERAEQAVEHEKVRTSWEVGKLINEHILLNKKRADYGAQVLKRLSKDLSISERELYYMTEFARTTPILRTSAKLSWGHIQSLLRINDDQERKAFAQRIGKGNWSVDKTRHEITQLKAERPKAVTAALKEPLLEPQKGIPYTYKIVRLEGRLQIDLGFSNYLLVPKKYAKSFKEGDIIQLRPAVNEPRTTKKDSYDLVKFNIPKNHGSWPVEHGPLFTYHARLLTVTDADTLWVFIDLGFCLTTVQQLRLRALDAPELNTREGIEAKKFVGKELKGTPELLITSSESDKYDRYLADVFYQNKKGEWFLNNRLLEERFAVRV